MLRPALCALSDMIRTKTTSSEHGSMSSSMQHAMLRYVYRMVSVWLLKIVLINKL